MKNINERNNFVFEFRPVTELFEEQVKLHPEKCAVVSGKESFTYAQLNERANRIANALVEKDVRRETIVGVVLERCCDFYAVRQGILKAGGAFAVATPDYPDDRIRYIFEDSGAPFIITTKEIAEERRELFAKLPCTVLLIEELLENENTENPQVKIGEHDLCYCIYTSGSTGKPKGVLIEHINLANFVNPDPKNAETYGYVSRGSVSLSMAAMTFDVSVLEEFLPLTNGMTAVIASDEEILNPLMLGELIVRNKVDIMTTTPTYLSNMIDLPQLEKAVSQIKVFDVGAEAFPPALYDKIRRVNPDAYIMNGYGPTETTISCTMKVITDSRNITIGTPNGNVKVYIVDKENKILPDGETGELVIAGLGVGRGYMNLPDKTEAVFIDLNGERAYKTGDLARISPEGEIEFFGRIDNQIKLRGLRIELGEIEGALLKHELVQNAAVTVIEKSGNKYITAYYTGESIPDEELKTFLEPLLPDYMMPSFFVYLEAMPVTPGGKIDKKALPMPEITTNTASYVEPVTAAQRTLCEIFEKALGIERVGIEDNFFELGGSSLTASKVAVMCLSKNISLVYADIFKYPTVRELAALIDNDGITETAQSKNEFSDYNYNRIQNVISANTEENADRITKEKLGDIMVTGATGFLGIHVLKAFLDNYDGKVYCLVRKGKYESPEKRMMNMLMYYFDDPYKELFESRIICVDGDITSKEQVTGFSEYKFSTIINCAACVKHFAADDVLERINVQGVENLIDFCKNNGRRLIQISTVSVAGEGSDGVPPMSRVFCENDLYIGQNITNEYIRTKFLAERAVLEAVSEGLDGKVIRVGNLMSRNSDGEFQINFITNGFLRSLRGYAAVGKFPMGGMHEVAEFSPIDSTALAVLRLAQTDRRFTVFHACNSHHIYMADLIYAMRSYGFRIDIVRDEEFETAVKEFAKTGQDSDAVSGLIAYTSHNENEIYTIDYSNRFTAQVLYRLDYKWPVTDDRYLENAIAALDRLTFFD